jgi:hypothetical protein
LNVGLDALPGFVGNAMMSGSLPALFGTVGESVTLYLYVLRAVGVLAPAVLAAGLGYRAIRGMDGPPTYRRLGRTATAGCIVGTLAGFVALVAANGGPGAPVLLAVATVGVAIDASVLVVASVLAGAALGSEKPFRRSETPEMSGEATR